MQRPRRQTPVLQEDGCDGQAQQPAGFVITMIVQDKLNRSEDKVFHSNNNNLRCVTPALKLELSA